MKTKNSSDSTPSTKSINILLRWIEENEKKLKEPKK